MLAETPPDPAAVIDVCVDADDPALPSYERVVAGTGAKLSVFEPQSRRLAGVLDAASTRSTACSHIGFMGDDHRPRTADWATKLVAACSVDRGPGIAYGDDLVHHAELPTAVVMDVRIPQALGRMTFPGSQHLFLDDYWRDLGRVLSGLYYVPAVVIEHLHPIRPELGVGWDEGYTYSHSPELWAKDERAYKSFVRGGGLHADAEAIGRHCKVP